MRNNNSRHRPSWDFHVLHVILTCGQSVSIFSSTFFAVIAMGLLDAIFLVTLDTCALTTKIDSVKTSIGS